MVPDDARDPGLQRLMKAIEALRAGREPPAPLPTDAPDLARALDDLRSTWRERAAEQRRCRKLEADAFFLESIVENIPYMVFVKDAEQLRFVRFNAAGEALLGHRRQDLIGRSDDDFFPPDEAAFFKEKDRQVLAGGQVLDIPEEPIHTADGQRWLHTRKIPIADPDGTPRFLLGISEDITPWRRARQELASRTEQLGQVNDALRSAEARLQLLVDHLPGALWTMDRGLKVTSASGAEAAPLGLVDAIGRSFLASPLHDGQERGTLHQAFEGRVVSYEVRVDGSTYEVRVERLPGADDELLGLALDITDRRRLEAERLQTRLQRAQKLESLGLLAGGIAHDFNNLLASILGNASLASLKLDDDSPAQPFLARVEATAERAADLTRQMLAYSGRGRFVIEKIDLRAVVRDIADLLRVSISKNASLVFDFPDELPRIEADAAQLRQLVMNLLTNASDALGDQPGTISVSVGAVRADHSYLSAAAIDADLDEGDYVWIEVADTGCGMDAETRAHMFDPFFTTKETGHGMGLSATLGIVRGHGGGLRVYSEPDHGTTIKILFPAVDGGVRPDIVSGEHRLPGSVLGTVLVVDDDEDVRAFAEAVLAEAGFDVITAKDGVEAVSRFREHKDQIVGVLLDMTMPRMNGEETFRELRRLQKNVRVLLTSGYNEQEATSRFAGKGLAGFIQKPYRARDLMARMAALVQAPKETRER